MPKPLLTLAPKLALMTATHLSDKRPLVLFVRVRLLKWKSGRVGLERVAWF